MKQVEETYISLLTDFGFKRIFGTAMNKNLLICFLISKTLLIRRPPRSTPLYSSAASDVYKRQGRYLRHPEVLAPPLPLRIRGEGCHQD